MVQHLVGFLTLAGRIALSAVFIGAGVNKVIDRSGTLAYMQAAGMPAEHVGLLLNGAIVFLLVGGALLATGLLGRLGAALLVVFLIPATLIFHNFWAYDGQDPQFRAQMIQFQKNLAMAGALLIVFARGSGPWSLRVPRRRPVDAPPAQKV